MDRPLLREQAPAEYFKELIESALARQHVQCRRTDTSYYLVNLLCQFVRPDARRPFADDADPLAIRLTRALQTAGPEQRARLRSLGDFSLFTTGFFADSLRRRTIDVDYYVSMGEYAYGSLSRHDEDAFADVFGELARKFVGFMDVLAEVSERTALRLEWRSPSSLREMAANRQPPRRTEARRSRNRAQRLHRQTFRPVKTFRQHRYVPIVAPSDRFVTFPGQPNQRVGIWRLNGH